MEINSPVIRSLKRNINDDTDNDNNIPVEQKTTTEMLLDNSKRFKGSDTTKHNLLAGKKGNTLLKPFAGSKDLLSPMTKISKDLANLNTLNDEADLINNRNEKSTQCLPEMDAVNVDSCESHQSPHANNGGGGLTRQRHSKMDSSMQNMSVDELSFYEDDITHQPEEFTMPARLQTDGHLLPPEGSPKHFRIIEKPSGRLNLQQQLQQRKQYLQRQHQQHGQEQQFSQQKLRQQQQHNIIDNASTNNSTDISSKTPSKNFRIFNSLSSSGSMESSMDDEYMELFEMESFDQTSNNQYNFNINLPSNLNSLISGTIKNASPAAANAINTVNTTNMLSTNRKIPRQPSVRRCLSMTENNQSFSQPKTPEMLKQKTVNINANTTPTYSMKLLNENYGDLTTTPLSNNSNFKRPDPPSSTASPIHPKRYRHIGEKENLDDSFRGSSFNKNKFKNITTSPAPTITAATTTTQSNRHLLKKSMSLNDAEILSALARFDCDDQPDLIGDFSKPFALPVMDGRHPDLKSISSETVARLLNGEYANDIANYQIIDCRYPYEYEGGHITGAKNLYTHEQIIGEFLTKQKTELQQAKNTEMNACHKRNIIIFHCEFSSERGPKLSRFLRQNDRARNTNLYPALDYPEIYLLHNGYKDFFETHSELCDPTAYRPMLEPSYNEEYKHFRAKSKSWNGDGIGGTGARPRKTRSRLML